MKTNKVFTATLIAALAFTACSNDEEINNSREEVKIVATIGAPTDSKLKATFENDGSGEFEVGDRFSLLYFSPSLLAGGLMTYEVGGGTPLYWDLIAPDGNPIDFTAWYPVYEESGTAQYKVADAATEAAKDLLMATKLPSVSKLQSVNLDFGHVMHKLVITLATNYYSTADLDNATITLKNLKSDASVNFRDGTVDDAAASGTDLYLPETGAWTEFIVAPQTLTAGANMIEILIGGKTFMYKVPASITKLESGKILKLNLDIRRDAVVLAYGAIAAWGFQDEIDEEVDFYEEIPEPQ